MDAAGATTTPQGGPAAINAIIDLTQLEDDHMDAIEDQDAARTPRRAGATAAAVVVGPQHGRSMAPGARATAPVVNSDHNTARFARRQERHAQAGTPYARGQRGAETQRREEPRLVGPAPTPARAIVIEDGTAAGPPRQRKREISDHVFDMERAFRQQEALDECYDGTAMAINYRDFADVFKNLSFHAETKRFAWTAPRSLALKATMRKKQESKHFEKHKATCTKGDECVRCNRGVRPMFLDDYKQTFLGTTPCGCEHAVVVATAACLCLPNKCLGCMVRITKVDYISPSPIAKAAKKTKATKKGKRPKAPLHPVLKARADVSKQRRALQVVQVRK